MRNILCTLLMTLSIPCDGARADSFLARRERALEALRAQRWQDAAAGLAELVGQNPDDGGLWRGLGLARLRLGRYDEAVEAYAGALRTGVSPPSNHYDMACAHALAGRTREALDALQRAYAAGFVDDELLRSDADLASLHQEVRFTGIVGWPDPSVEKREERWSRDLDFLARRVREVHWRPFAHLPEAAFTERLEAIRARIPAISDLALRLEIQGLLAAIGDGHTSVVRDEFLLHHGEGTVEGRFLPLELFWYDDGVRVIATTPELERLAGARVQALGGVGIEELCRRLDVLVSRDNEWGARWGIAQTLADPKTLAGLGLGDLETGFAIRVERLDGVVESVRLAAGGRESRPSRRLDQVLGKDAPVSKQHKEEHLWLCVLEKSLYARIDAIGDAHSESFQEFTDRLFVTAEEAGSEALILDLRDNPGGQGHLTRPLLHRLIASERFNRPGGLYVLVGRKTFSAAMALAAQLELHTQARFAGEPTGSRPNFVGESTRMRLPYSGLMVSISSRYHQNGGSQDQRLWIAPDLPAAPRFENEKQGRDVALEAVLAEIPTAR